MSYTIPVSVAYTVSESVASAASVMSATASSVLNEEVVAAATATAGAFLKRLVYRAAGEEGLAENVMKGSTQASQQPVVHEPQHVFHQPAQDVRHRTHYQEVHCINTTGQSFAIWLNLIYLAPLTGLFVRFFIKSYIRRTSASTKHPTKKRTLSKSGHDAVRGLEREIDSLGKAAEDMEIKAAKKVKSKSKNTQQGKSGQENKDASSSNDQRAKKVVEDFNRKVSESLEKANLNGQATLDAARDIAKDVIEKASPRREKKQSAPAAKKDDRQSKETPEPTKDDRKDSRTKPKVEKNEKEEAVLEDSKIEPLKDQKESNQVNGDSVKKEEETKEETNGSAEPQGLSSTNPTDTGVGYADMIKKSKE